MHEAEARAQNIGRPQGGGIGWQAAVGCCASDNARVHRVGCRATKSAAEPRSPGLPQHQASGDRAQGPGQPHCEGVGQAKRCAAKLAVRFAYATNGRAICRIETQTGAEGEVEGYPGPQPLRGLTFAEANI